MLNAADPPFVSHLQSLLPAACFRAPTPGYFEEPRGRFHGVPAPVLAPATTEEVAALIRACNSARVGVVPYGGGTGLVGGQIQPDGPAPVVLSLERMRAIRRPADPRENVLVVEAGMILADVQAEAERVGRLFPLSLASEGSTRIGGNLSTNAGGLNVLRYGNARDLCLGIEAVLPDGTVFNGLTRLRKDNTGYDLRNLLIGAEGTLGIITAAALKLFLQPANRMTALFVVDSPAAALDLLALARDVAGEAISAFELIGRTGFDFLTEHFPDLRQPFARPPQWAVLTELGLSGGGDAQAALEALFEQAAEAGLVSDGVVAHSQAQSAALWALRETIPAANKRIGSIASHDISLPLSAIPDFIETCSTALAALAPFRINCFGHLGDGNLHYNLFPPQGQSRDAYDNIRKQATKIVHDHVHAMAGSFSAEHGVGRMKTGDLETYGDPGKLFAMRAIKAALDPNGIMNPGAMLAQGH
ncbi:FAD-binding oxidoreductase [Actibacterium mucosum]|uniref:FAD-binding oxidoreductase n=1 Tax=Actibacterium mucosum TaxID=1087332 RepID=UPI00054D1D2F|nr:FAD-binding oxidoreductase [Actibacterium mucosum]